MWFHQHHILSILKGLCFMSRSFRLRGDDNFIVMATDGLWEVINPKACIEIINQLINQYSLQVGNHEFLLNSRRFVMFCTGFHNNEEVMIISLLY